MKLVFQTYFISWLCSFDTDIIDNTINSSIKAVLLFNPRIRPWVTHVTMWCLGVFFFNVDRIPAMLHNPFLLFYLGWRRGQWGHRGIYILIGLCLNRIGDCLPRWLDPIKAVKGVNFVIKTTHSVWAMLYTGT